MILKNKLLGIGLAVIIMIAAKLLSGYLPTLGTALLALIMGVLVRQFLTNFSPFSSGVSWTEKYVLETAIVFIGFGFEFTKIQSLGLSSVGMIVFSIILVMLLALLLQKIFGNKGKLFWLLGAGSAICGSSAIGATAPLLKSKEEETGISLAVVNILGLLGMILLPFISGLLGFSATETGIFLGGILQSVGHVVGAGFSISEDVGQIATIVKMGRISLLMPFLLLVYFLFKKSSDGTKIKFPVFILFFVLAILFSQINLFSEGTLKLLSKSGDTLLNIGMAAIGLKINLKSLWKISGKAFLAGVIIFSFQILIVMIFLILK